MNESYSMNHTVHQFQQLIASYTGKLLREHFGKGPESVLVSIGGRYITIYLRNFLASSERILLQQEHVMIINQMRDKLMQMVNPEIIGYIHQLTGVKPSEIYYDWALHNQSGMITIICPDYLDQELELREDYYGKEELERAVLLISQQAQKPPEQLYSCEMNNRILLFVREGILVPIEKEFIRLGHGELLKEVKRNLDKNLLCNCEGFELILNRPVLDVFVDWNYELDKSIIVIVTGNPKTTKS
ncbi:Na-translocating system protein MpsC family protein [Paenibacillus sp. GCM10028914]|uniref:Na-translocating system protein MpsC family protein n=1 Tax=Paenibacillus sp. GCM10028914 TaxID=3273416 RepID=UPI00361C01E1